MSFEPDNIEQDLNVKELLVVIAQELKLLNARFAEAFETDTELEDI